MFFDYYFILGDYVYDCAWSPQHPALFAAVDGTGRLDLWNLNKDTEVASASVTVEGGAALNRVTWTQSGLHVAAGDDLGKIWVYDVGEQLAVPQPDEWNKFNHTLQVVTIVTNQVREDHHESDHVFYLFDRIIYCIFCQILLSCQD